MKLFNRLKNKGISLRMTHLIMVALAIIIAAILVFQIYEAAYIYSNLSKATNKYLSLQKSASGLMDGSDYLTQEVQDFTVTTDSSHMENYFREANVTKSRDKAMAAVEELAGETQAFKDLQKAMEESIALMNREFYAMRLVVEAKYISDYPEELKAVVLSPEDMNLSDSEKIAKAQTIVHDTDYYNVKSLIRDNMNKCLEELEKSVYAEQTSLDKAMNQKIKLIIAWIIVLIVGIFVFVLLLSILGINPLVKSVKKLRTDGELPTEGAREFRYLAHVYNGLYNEVKRNMENLNYKASHDKLTGLYNRAGYDVLKSNLDHKNTAIMMIDADHFKEINDSHGHDVGDKVLQRIAKVLKDTFRQDDYICRIGGDEFVVFMVNIEEECKDLIKTKTELINEALTKDDSHLPSITISAGAVFGKNEEDPDVMMKHVDKALYERKEKGRKGVSFYNPNIK